MARPRLFRKGKPLVPAWHEVRAGPAEGRWIYVAAESPMFREMVEGVYDPFFWQFLSRHDLRGSTVYDIGAHIGYHALCFERLTGPDGRVHVFEPNPQNLERMDMIRRRNGVEERIVRHPVALAERSGEGEFNFSTNIDNQTSSGGYLEGSHPPSDQSVYARAGFTRSVVPISTMDEIANDHPPARLGLIKIDVEGAEHEVLRGGRATIARHRPVLLIEIHSVICMMHVAELLTRLDYTMTVLDDRDAVAGRGRCFIAAEPSRKPGASPGDDASLGGTTDRSPPRREQSLLR